MTLTKKAIKSFEAAITAARIIKQDAEKSGDTEKVQLCNQELVAYSMSLYYIGYDFYCDNYIAHVYKMEKENAEWLGRANKRAVEIHRPLFYKLNFIALVS